MNSKGNMKHAVCAEVAHGATGGVEGDAKCHNPILPRRRGREDGDTEFRSAGDDPPTSTLRPSDEGTGDQYRVVPQPSAAAVEAEAQQLAQPQQTQEACCLVDEDDDTRDDSPSDPEERTIKPVDGLLVDAQSYESVALGSQRMGEGHRAAPHMPEPAGIVQQKDGLNLHSHKRKSSPQHSQGGSGATVTSGDGLGAACATQKKRKVIKVTKLLSTEAAAQGANDGAHEDTSGDGTRRGSGGSGGGSNDDVEMQGKEKPEPGNADELGEDGNLETSEGEEGVAVAGQRGGSRGSESRQVGTGHPPSLSMPLSSKHPSAQLLKQQPSGLNLNLQKQKMKKEEDAARAQSAPPGQNTAEQKRRKKAGQAAMQPPPPGGAASLQAPWLPSLPLQQLTSVCGDPNTSNNTLHQSRQSLQSMESFYSQAQQRFLCQAQDIMHAAITATQTGAPGPTPDLQAITRACATAVGIINSFAVSAAAPMPMATPRAPPVAPLQPPAAPLAAGIWPAAATTSMFYGGMNNGVMPGPMPMPLPFPLSLPMHLGMGMGLSAPRPTSLQATLGGPGAVDALKMQGGGPLPLNQVPLAPMVPVEMLPMFPNNNKVPTPRNVLQVPPLHSSGKIV